MNKPRVKHQICHGKTQLKALIYSVHPYHLEVYFNAFVVYAKLVTINYDRLESFLSLLTIPRFCTFCITFVRKLGT